LGTAEQIRCAQSAHSERLGIPPTGKQVNVTGITITLISNGKSVESWGEFDALGMLQQIGVIPKMG